MERNIPTALQTQAVKALTTPFGVAATNLLTSTAHGYSAGDPVKFPSLVGGAGLVVGQVYYVIAAGLTANDFSVSTTVGGGAVDFTTDVTSGTVQRIITWATAKGHFTTEQRGYIARWQDAQTPLIADTVIVDNDALRSFFAYGTLP
jgi:hypothetical protein